MGETIRLEASDGHALSAYRARAKGVRKGGVVVVQEVFGVNSHIRSVCDRFAAAGYEAVAPALFDRLRSGVELDYDEIGIAEGRTLVSELGWDNPLVDIDAAARALDPNGAVGVVGYCWGGSVSFLAACQLNVACVAAYYGRHIVEFLGETPHCPLILHFGTEDPLIPIENVEKIRVAFPDVPIYLYHGAGHGFNCDQRKDYRADAAKIALDRTLSLFAQHLA
ncbi:Carboxymethylenebutenolidase (Dienelactone hydrolase) (DLH) [uncultured Defluviicoccus sp.]|uniref:Carboxymethylenebutenolidase (Dienelactone hydrolase) (DLH) n=1 Tax=metagenome TaxID=256318 RepID=A0A380TEI5_9ZZZZ|nr:Carboxymethylenebutenolidase (Dienelactone hydrolase) (DLH) [uncultured Defluviicoccus sp.]